MKVWCFFITIYSLTLERNDHTLLHVAAAFRTSKISMSHSFIHFKEISTKSSVSSHKCIISPLTCFKSPAIGPFLVQNKYDNRLYSQMSNEGIDGIVDDFIPNPLAVPGDTPLVLGMNKYSHDVSVCAANQNTGEVLFYLSKERLTRKKHDAGSIHTLVDKCLECLELDLENVKKIVVNNHHHRVLPLEQNEEHIQWQVGLGVNDNGGGFGDDENLLLDCKEKVSEFLGFKKYFYFWMSLHFFRRNEYFLDISF